jgi:transcriptional regulator with XRE-family HTH domain
MSRTLDGPEVTKLVAIIAAEAPGSGAALRELRKMAGLSQRAVAEAIGLSKTVLSHYEAERHRPKADVLRNMLLTLRVDIRIVSAHLGGTVALDVNTDLQSAVLKVSQTVASLPDADAETIEEALLERYGAHIIAAQVAKALAGDAKAAGFVLERGDRLRDERRRQKHSDGANTSAAQFIQHPRSAIDTSIFEDEPERDEAHSANTPESIFAPAIPRDAGREAPEPIIEKSHGDPDGPFGAEPFVNAGDEQPSRRRGRSLIASLGLPSFT